MTETSPIGLVSRLSPELARADDATRYKLRAKQGVPAAARRSARAQRSRRRAARRRDQRRGARARPVDRGDATPAARRRSAGRATATSAPAMSRRVDEHGFVQLVDRDRRPDQERRRVDRVGELENALMGHPAVREAAVIGVAASEVERAAARGRRAQARARRRPPTSCARSSPRSSRSSGCPTRSCSIDAIPRTSAGKFQKTELRKRYRG